MVDLINSVSHAITLALRLREISENIKEAEFKSVLADLTLELADVKMKLAGVLEENASLKERIHELEGTEGEPCPKCHQRGWHIESSRADPTFGGLGVMRRVYKCSLCGFTEEKSVTP